MICVGDGEVWSVSVYCIREISVKTGMVSIHCTCRGVYWHIQSSPIKLSKSLEVNPWTEFSRVQ